MPIQSTKHKGEFTTMSKIIYTYEDLGYAVKLICINLITLECGNKHYFLSQESSNRLLQGDDASNFLEEIEKLDKVWENGSPNPSVFADYETHLAVLIEPYF
jgi:hypothetical protein